MVSLQSSPKRVLWDQPFTWKILATCFIFICLCLCGSICKQRSWLKSLEFSLFKNSQEKWKLPLEPTCEFQYIDLGFCSSGHAGLYIDIKKTENSTQLYIASHHHHIHPFSNYFACTFKVKKTWWFSFYLEIWVHCYFTIRDHVRLSLQKVSPITVLV